MEDDKEVLNRDSIGIRQEITVVVEVQDGEIKKIHNAYSYQPVIHFKGGSIKWYEDSGGK